MPISDLPHIPDGLYGASIRRRTGLTAAAQNRTVPRMKWIGVVILMFPAGAAIASLWRLAEPSRAFDFSTFYAAGMLATTPDASAVFDRVPEDLSRTPPEGALARAAADAGYPAVPGQYFNLPVVMLLYKPLTWFDFPTAYRIVVITNLVALVALAWLVVRLTASSTTPGERRVGRAQQNPPPAAPAPSPSKENHLSAANAVIATLVLLFLAAISHPVRYNVELGNISVLLTLAVVAAYASDVRNHGVVGGVLLGVAIIIKPAPALLLVYFLLRRRWIITLSTAATVMALLVTGLIYYGPDMHLRWLEIIRWNGSHTFVAWNNQSLLAALLRFTVPPYEIAAWDVHAAPPWIVRTPRTFLLAALLAWSIVIYRYRTRPRGDAEFAAGMILMTVALPFAWTHYFIVLLWPTALIAARLLTMRREDILKWLLFAIVIVAWIVSPLTVFEFTQRWRTLPLIGDLAPRLLVSHVIAAAIVLFILMLRRSTPADATPAPVSTQTE